MENRVFNRHIVFLSHLDLNIYLFRRPIMQALVKRNCRVTALVPEGAYTDRFQRDGIGHVSYTISRQGMNPFQELALVLNLWRILRSLSPDLVHTFTIKPNIYGTIAARLAGVPTIINSVTGLGSFFVEAARWAPIQFMLRRLYQVSCAMTNAVIFQNNDDLHHFLNGGLISPKKAHLIRGSGVDLERFCPTRLSQEDRANLRAALGISHTAVVITILARLIWDKGIREFCECAQHIRRKYGQQVISLLVGDYYDGNPNTVPRAYIEAAMQRGDIVFAGWQDDVPGILHISDIVVLPSYREGLPVSLQEAMAMAKPIVTTDVPGCREIVENGENGFLVPVRDAQALVQAVSHLVCNSKLRKLMGDRSRKKAEQEFDVKKIITDHIVLYEKLLA